MGFASRYMYVELLCCEGNREQLGNEAKLYAYRKFEVNAMTRRKSVKQIMIYKYKLDNEGSNKNGKSQTDA